MQETFNSLHDSLRHDQSKKDQLEQLLQDNLSPKLTTPSEVSFGDKEHYGTTSKEDLEGSKKRKRSINELVETNINRGHWQFQENLKYHWFLEAHYQHYVNRQMRRMDKIFKIMQTFIGTRQAEQCRSHHQKMQKKHLTFPCIVKNLRLRHYNTLQIDTLKQDMEKNGLKFRDGVTSVEQLQEDVRSIQPPLLLGDRRKSINNRNKNEWKFLQQQEAQQQQKQQIFHNHQESLQILCGFEQPHDNARHLLEESNMQLGQLELFHQKEDISCFLASQHNQI